jgi:RNA-splicing ligase RtcB
MQCALHCVAALCAGSTRGMAVPARFFASPLLLDMVVSEAQASGGGGSGGFTASLQQLANVATLPGIVGECDILVFRFG